MGLQRLIVEKKALLYDSQKHGFLLRRSVALLSGRWTLGKKASGDYLLIQEDILTIPTFQAPNVRFSVKIFAKKFESSQKQDSAVRINRHRKSTRPLPIGCHKMIYMVEFDESMCRLPVEKVVVKKRLSEIRFYKRNGSRYMTDRSIEVSTCISSSH